MHAIEHANIAPSRKISVSYYQITTEHAKFNSPSPSVFLGPNWTVGSNGWWPSGIFAWKICYWPGISYIWVGIQINYQLTRTLIILNFVSKIDRKVNYLSENQEKFKEIKMAHRAAVSFIFSRMISAIILSTTS